MSMKIEKTKEENVVELKFDIESKELDNAIEKVYNKNKRHFSLPGFRKGKAPFEIILKSYGPEMFYEDAFNELFPSIYEKEIDKAKLEVFSAPEINVEKIEKGSNVLVNCKVALKPEVKLGKYQEISIKKPEYKVNDKDIDEEIKKTQEQNVRLIPLKEKRAVKSGDLANINFIGYMENEDRKKGEKFPGGEAEKFDLEIGSNSFIPGFEEEIIGMKSGETKDIHLNFPEEYFEESLKGKPVIFEVTLNEIKEKEYPKLDDELAKDQGFEDLKAYRKDIKDNLEKELEEKSKAETDELVKDELVKLAKIDLPEMVVNSRVNEMIENLNHNLSHQGLNLDFYLQMYGKTLDEYIEETKPSVEKKIKTDLILEAIFNENEKELDKKKIDEAIEEYAKGYNLDLKELKDNKDFMKNIKNEIKPKIALDYLLGIIKYK